VRLLKDVTKIAIASSPLRPGSLRAGRGGGRDPVISRVFWIPRSSRGMTEKGLIQRFHNFVIIEFGQGHWFGKDK
jgi:hypothetical protein